MSDRVKGLMVALDQDYRDDDVEQIVQAIRMIRGVIGCELEIRGPDDWLLRERIRQEFAKKLFDVVK